MKASDLEQLIFNPFHISKILHHFLLGAQSIQNQTIKTELLYLVLPFIYEESICNKLSNLNKNSKFSPIIENKDFEIFISVLNNKIKDYKIPTNIAIIVLSNYFKLEIGDYTRIDEEIHYKEEENKILRKIYKSSYNLGLIMIKESYLTVFRKLKIVEL